MMKFTPPVRFITAILTIWIGLRVIFWTPSDLPPPLIQMPSSLLPTSPALQALEASSPDANSSHASIFLHPVAHGGIYERQATVSRVPGFVVSPPTAGVNCGARCTPTHLAAHIPPRNPSTPASTPVAARRFSLSSWVQWRSGSSVNALASDGELGGSQAGIGIRYRITRGAGIEAALAARLSRPLERGKGAEAAIGIALHPSAQIPVVLIAERRIGLDNGGRNAWSLGMVGGLYRQPLPLGLELDGYAQAGIVGTRRRDLYGDVALVVSQPIALSERSTLSFGGGVWAGAQPGVSRIDIGPEASVRFPAGDSGARLSLGWRQRISGSASPGSGPVLTLGTDF